MQVTAILSTSVKYKHVLDTRTLTGPLAMAPQFGANQAMKRPTAFNQSWSFGLDFLGWCARGPLPLPQPPSQRSLNAGRATILHHQCLLGLAAILRRGLAVAL